MPGFNFLKERLPVSNKKQSFENWITKFDLSALKSCDYKDFQFSTFSNIHNPTTLIFSDDQADIYMDGFVFDLSQKQLEQKLKEQFVSVSTVELRKAAEQFSSSVKGDYVFFIYFKTKSAWFIFNSAMARLPIYYYHDGNKIIVSRNLRYVIANVDNLAINKFSLVDKFVFGYTIDHNTLFEGIKLLGFKGSILIEDHKFSCTVNQTDIDISATPTSLSRSAFLDNVLEEHIDNYKSYLSKFDNEDFCLTADLSGGIDSRMNLGMIKRLNGNSNFHCSSVKGFYNEATYASRIYDIIKPNGKFFDFYSDNDFNQPAEEKNEMLLRIDGLVPLTSGMISYDLIKLVSNYDTTKPIMRLSGLGFSDFLRKGFVKVGSSNDMLSFILSKYSPFLPVQFVCNLVGVNYDTYLDYLKSVIKSWPEKNIKDQIFKLYFIYQTTYSSSVAEDNERDFACNLNPMWDFNLSIRVARELPLKWRSHYTTALFLQKINSDLLKGELNHKHINIADLSDLRKKELINNYWMKFKNTNKAYISSKEFVKSVLRKDVINPLKTSMLSWSSRLEASEFDYFNEQYVNQMDEFGVFKRDLLLTTENYFKSVYKIKNQ